MAVVSGYQVDTGRSYGDVPSGSRGRDVSQREDLANFISMITRDETPFMSTIGKTKATAIYHEWQTDQLQAPGTSRIGEGTDYIIPTGINTGVDGLPSGGEGNSVATTPAPGSTFATTGPQRARYGNYTQINGKTIAVSGTRRAIDQAGVADEYAYQLKKRGTELRRDLEFDLIHSFNVAQAGAVGNSQAATSANPNLPGYGGARSFGGYQAWINQGEGLETNTSLGGNVIYKGNFEQPADGSVADGTGVPRISTGGSPTGKAPLALSDIDLAMQRLYQNGGKANKLMVSPKLRRDFSDLMVTDSGVRRNIDMDGKLRQSVDVYMSDFGDVMVVPNYIMGLSRMVSLPTVGGANQNVEIADFTALLYDPMWFSIATLRPLQEVDVGQRGDSTVGMMIEECTLEVKNPQGAAAIYGLV